jgi:ERF superfamily.
MISLAMANGTDLDQLEKLLSLQERWEKSNAVKEYNKAMALFKANPPRIEKDKSVNYTTSGGSVKYNHATLANVVEKITAELSKYGLSASWRTAQNGKEVTVTCRISHSAGHSEETSLCASTEGAGKMNAVQAIGSVITYLQRYSLLAITGLAAHDQDNDARIEEELIDENKVSIIEGLIKELNVDTEKFYKFMNVTAVNEIKASDFSKAKLALENRRQKK